jgi:putative ABC transport system ATP-binding protein
MRNPLAGLRISSGEVPLIAVEGLTRSYRLGQNQVQALREVDLRVSAGEFVAMMGASGSGKSTLLHLIGCLDSPTAGAYWFEGREVSRLTRAERALVRSRRIGFIFQNFFLLPGMTALENVALPLEYQPETLPVEPRARAALEQVGLGDRAAHRPAELSGGERQRVAIARALVSRPAVLLADEPTGNLDSATGGEILAILTALWKEGLTILLVTHDAQIAAHAQRILTLQDGRIAGEQVLHATR